MRRVLAVLLVAAAVLAACGGADDDDLSASTFTFPKLDGSGEGSIADYDGTPLVVNFFGNWCAPCTAEMPAFERVHQTYGDRVAFLGLSVNETVDEALALVERTGVTWDLGRDPDGKLLRDLGGIGMPTTVLIGADGEVREVHTGELSEQELTERLETHFFS